MIWFTFFPNWYLVQLVATTSVRRVFSATTLVKTKLRNKMGDSLVTYIERAGHFLLKRMNMI
jgi:hypothetical protein